MSRGVQVRVGAMEEEAIWRDEVPATGPMLGVSPAPVDLSGHPANPTR